MHDKFNTVYVKNLPDAYSKADGSNNAKILEIEQGEAAKLRESLAQIFESLDIDKASGAVLDMYGDMVGQKRGLASDDIYRPMIKTRIVRNFTSGDYNSIVNALSLIFNCSPTDFRFVDKDDATVVLEELPIEFVNNNGISGEEAVLLIRTLMPSGVSLSSVSFDGTFEFAEGDAEYDEEKGFADDDQTIGGYLGFASSGLSADLPI